MKKILKWIDMHLEQTMVIGLIVLLLFVVVVEVVRRYILNNSSPYSEEIARFIMIYAVYLGVPYAIRHKKHIACEVLPSKTPYKLSVLVDVFSYLCFLGFSLLMVYQTYNLVLNQIAAHKVSEAMHIPLWYFSIAPGIGFGIGIFRIVQMIYFKIKSLTVKTVY